DVLTPLVVANFALDVEHSTGNGVVTWCERGSIADKGATAGRVSRRRGADHRRNEVKAVVGAVHLALVQVVRKGAVPAPVVNQRELLAAFPQPGKVIEAFLLTFGCRPTNARRATAVSAKLVAVVGRHPIEEPASGCGLRHLTPDERSAHYSRYWRASRPMQR